MTFSRPGIGSVNIGPGSNKGNIPKVVLPKKSTVSADAPYRPDTAAPGIAYQNEQARFQEIQSFISFFQKDVVPFVNKELDRKAKNELGTFLDENPDALDPQNTTPELMEARAKLSPKVKDLLIGAQGATGAVSYRNKLMEALATPENVAILSNPSEDPDAVAQRAQVTRQAQAEAGKVFPNTYQRLQYADRVAQANASVSSEFYKKRINAQAEVNIQTQGKAFGSQLTEAVDIATKASTETEGGPDFQLPSLNYTVQNAVATLNESTTGAEAARGILIGIDYAIDKEPDVGNQIELLETLQKSFNELDLKGSDGIDIATITVPGYQGNLSDLLERRIEVLKKEDDEDKFQELLLKQRELIRAGDPEAAEQLALNAQFHSSLFKNRLAENAYTLGTRPTLGQRQTELAILRDMASTGKTWTDVLETLSGQNVSDAFTRRVAEGAVNDNNNPLFGQSSQARAAAQQMGSKSGAQFTDAGFYAPNGWLETSEDKEAILDELKKYAGADKNTAEGAEIIAKGTPLADMEKLQFELAVQEEMEAELIRQQDAGERNINIREIQERAIDKINNDRFKEAYPNGVPKPPSLLQQYTKFESNAKRTTLQASQANAGAFTIPQAAIDPMVFQAWQKANSDKKYGDLRMKEREGLLIQSYQSKKKIDNGVERNFTRKEAEEKYQEFEKVIMKELEEIESTPGYTRTGLPNQVERVERMKERQKRFPNAPSDPNDPSYDTTGERFQQAGQAIQSGVDALGNGLQLFNNKVAIPIIQWTIEQQDKAIDNRMNQGKPDANGDQSNAGDDVVEFYNSGGFGPKAMEVASSMLNLVVGASPATAGPLENADAESLQAFRESWSSKEVGLSTKPLPQVAAATPARFVPSAITNDRHEMFVLIGVAEGTRTAGGGYTGEYQNRGTIRGNQTPEQDDRRWMALLTQRMSQAAPALRAVGLEPGTVGFNRLLFNVLDLSVQSPQTVGGLIQQFPQIGQQNFTIEAIAKARADSFFDPQGRLVAGDYRSLFKDQRSRAGVFDYRRRL